ncbi:MAG: TIGR04295 family B12-binding domain-containing radical SAM protein [Pseudomonadota bacterium]
MKYALVNPHWRFDGSIYFGCPEPHLPLEYGYARQLLEVEGHEVLLVDGHLEQLSREAIRDRVADFAPDFTVVTTAPSYLFWRCAQPELRVPQETVRDLRAVGGTLIGVGPHGSSTPGIVLQKLGVDVLVMGECEDVLPQLAERDTWPFLQSICYWQDGRPRVQGGPHATDMSLLPALRWPDALVRRHGHHHHRFDGAPQGPGAEMEASRGCPYHCSFCAKDNFRDQYRRRPLAVVLEELDGLIAQGVEYIYFIDEIFLPNRELLEALAARPVKFGVQTRIDLWKPDMIDLLGRAGCVSIEAGVESISEEGRQLLDKNCRLSTPELAERLIHAKRLVPFVQATLMESKVDDMEAVEAWRAHLQAHGVWANKPVPLFAYPGSPDYRKRWGAPDDQAWERAHADYLAQFSEFSDIQTEQPLPLSLLELCEAERRAP